MPCMALARPDLQRLSPVPLKQQIIDYITAAVESGHLQPGEKLPAGRELADEWEVGYSTINEAVKVLVGRGVLVTGQGKGTFVRRRPGE
jgi:DNA-binding GntR family transcriptional regulator